MVVQQKGKNIIIVEDDDFLRGLLLHNMHDAGFNVKAASDAESAFTHLQTHNPDLILLDLVLPGMNGFDFLTELKDKRKLQVPVIVLSKWGSQDDVDLAMSRGANYFMIKANVTPKQIIDKALSVLWKNDKESCYEK